MSSLPRNLPNLNNDDIYSMSMMLLYASKDNPKYSTLSELMFILDHDNFLNFIKYFEGQTIQVPTLSDMSDSIKALLLYQYVVLEKQDFYQAMELVGIPREQSREAKRILSNFKKTVERYNYKIGGTIV